MVDIVLFAITVAATLAILWPLWCNEKTYRNKIRLLDRYRESGFVDEKLRRMAYDVSYEDEFYDRLFLRNWRKRYEVKTLEK